MTTQFFTSCSVPVLNMLLFTAALKGASKSGTADALLRSYGGSALLAGTAFECVLALWRPEIPLPLLLAISASVVCAATDLATGYVFDAVTIPAAACCLAASALQAKLQFSFAGAGLCTSLYAALYAVTRRRGIGLGDVKLACCIGAGFGMRDAMTASGIAFIAGGCYAALLLFRGAPRGSTMRFAPYMAAGALVCAIPGVA